MKERTGYTVVLFRITIEEMDEGKGSAANADSFPSRSYVNKLVKEATKEALRDEPNLKILNSVVVRREFGCFEDIIMMIINGIPWLNDGDIPPYALKFIEQGLVLAEKGIGSRVLDYAERCDLLRSIICNHVAVSLARKLSSFNKKVICRVGDCDLDRFLQICDKQKS